MSLEINDLSFYIKKKGPLNLENQMGVKSFIYGPLLMVFCKTLCKQMCLEICIRKNICLKKKISCQFMPLLGMFYLIHKGEGVTLK